jgi:hypothetical protein
VEFALQILRKPEEVQQILDAGKLAKRGLRYLTKRVLFPVRFLYTARTGEIGRVDAAVDHYVRQGTPAASLVTEALRWRLEPPAESEALRMLSPHVLPLYLEFLEDHVHRMKEYGEMSLASQLSAWRRDLQGGDKPTDAVARQ